MNFTQNRVLNVLSSSRNVRDFYSNNSLKNALLQKAITIAEFEKKVILVRNLKKASLVERLLIMQKAAKATKKVSAKLGIPTEFFAFLKNSDYLFSFFKELKRERVDINTLRQSDVYAGYDEHLSILEELQKTYFTMLKNSGFYDDISVCDEFEINFDFIKHYDEIHLQIDGILSKFDLEIISSIAKKCSVFLNFTSSKFNQKTVSSIAQISGLKFDIGKEYTLNLGQKEIVSQKETSKNHTIKIKEFSIRSLQCAYIFDEVSEFIRKGVDPKNIAVVLPDESFCETLVNLDENNMLNYAMGKSFKNENIYILLNALKTALDDGLAYSFDDAYLEKSSSLNSIISLLNYFKFPSEIYQRLLENYQQKCSFERFSELLWDIVNTLEISSDINEILKNEQFVLKQLLSDNEFSLDVILEIFLMKLKEISLSMVGGGEVTVLGILESRSKIYDAVVIVDFNDNLVPHPSQKEMFLSSSVRKKAGLISHLDRENLQRFYYESLINRAKFVSISYLSDEEHIVSRFARDFDICKDEKYPQDSYLQALNKESANLDLSLRDIILKHDFFSYPLSFSRLDTYNTCKRKYYYKYILKIGGYRNFADETKAKEFGSIIHECLRAYFSKFSDKFDKNEFYSILKSYKNRINLLDFELFKLKLDEFENIQNEHFGSGFKVIECEKTFTSKLCGIEITGKIDRIDRGLDYDLLIDYKTGAVNEKSFQLAFYEALYGKCESCYFSFLNNEFIKNGSNLDTLKECINSLKAEFSSEVCFERNPKACAYCDYALFCKKELK